MFLPIAIAVVTPQQPNIVLFIVDDLGWQDTSVEFADKPTEFNKTYRTPNLKSISQESTKFTQAYSACTVCTPSRTAIMSGKSPARTHITYWTYNGDTSSPEPIIKAPSWQKNGLLPKDGPFLPELLSKSGYFTIHAGKAHFGALNSFAANPKAIGFQENIAGSEIGHPGSFYGTDNFMNSLRQGQPEKPSSHDVLGLSEYHQKDIYLTEAIADKTVKMMRKVKKDQPIFLNFATYAVHTPIMANKRLLANYANLDPREAAYATMIESYDNAIGEIVNELKAQNRWENTLFIFTSDNGGLSVHSRAGNDDRNSPLRGGKGTFFEGGTRVPLIIHTPQQSQPITKNQPVIGTDLFAFILQKAGAKIPPGIDADPRRFQNSLDRPLIWHTPHFWGMKGQGIEPYSAIRSADFKLIYKHRTQTFELYNLATDIGETANIADSKPIVVKSLSQKLGQELRSLGAQMPIVKATNQSLPYPDRIPIL